MIQVDVFWSFAMGASLATIAGDRLKAEPSMWVNRYFLFVVCYLSLIFSPSGVYLLWQHTGWETMFFFDYSDLHGLFPCLFAMTNVLLGIIGFFVCSYLVRHDRPHVAHLLWTASYTCMFAILTFGYDRFLYPGSITEWRKGIKYPLTDFFSSRVFYTLLVMGIFVLPPLYFAMIRWSTGRTMDKYRRAKLLSDAFTPYYRVSGLIISVYLFLLFVLKVLPVHWHVDRLFAFLLGQAFFGIAIFAPIYLIPVTVTERSTGKKVN